MPIWWAAEGGVGMWFAFGLITLSVTAWLLFRWRLANRWKGKPGTQDGKSYEYAISQNKGRVVQLRIGIDCATGMHFCLKRENWIDRLFKSLGLSQEQQLNRLHFDERVYVLSDDKRLSYLLRLKSELHAPLSEFFGPGECAGFRIRKLWCRDKRLWIEAKPAKSMKAADCNPQDLAEDVLPVMRELAELLASSASPGSGSPDHFFLKACLLTAISSALAIVAGLQLFRLGIAKFPVVVDNTELMMLSLGVGSFLLLLLLGACVMFLGRTSRMHLVLLELLFIGGFGCVAGVYAELRDYNIDFDSMAARPVEADVIRHYTRRCGKNGRSTCYHVDLAAGGELDRRLSLKLDAATWRRLHAGGTVNLPLHLGALGMRWIDAPEPVPSQGKP